MAKSEAAGSQAEKKRSGIVSQMLSWPFTIVGIVVISILCSIIIEWLGIYFNWFDAPGSDHAYQTLVSEMGYLDTNFKRSLIVSEPVQFATDLIETCNEWLFIKTGIAAWTQSHVTPGSWLSTIQMYLTAAMYVTLMTLTRCVILLLTLPLFLIAALIGLTDGLVSRDLRRFGAGRESAFIYHHAKRLVSPIFLTAWLIYLSLPFSVHPNLFLLPCALLFGFMVSIAASSFKKYL